MYSTRLFILYRLGSHNILILYIYFISYIDFIHISNRRFWESDIHVTYIYIYCYGLSSDSPNYFFFRKSHPISLVVQWLITPSPPLRHIFFRPDKARPKHPRTSPSLTHTRARPFIPRRESVQMMYRRAAVPSYLVRLTVNGKRPK